MGLIIHRGTNGAVRPTWWGRIIYKGKAHETNLGVPIRGKIPLDADGKISLSDKGDATFERSRNAATKALEAWRRETRANPAELQEKAYKAHTNVSMSGVPLPKLIDRWTGLKRQRKPTAERTRNARLTFQRFGDFARAFADKGGKRCDTLNDVTAEMAAAWFDSIKGAYAWGTVKDMMHLMSGAFRRWATNGQHNPFSDIVLRGSKEEGEEKRRTERKALTQEQFDRLLECSRENERLYPLVVCAAYTGMRIGDVCRLQVSDVDLKSNTIDCVTAKAGVRVNIPILSPVFRSVLKRHCALPGDGSSASPYVFPWAAAQYARNRTSIVRGVKPYFAKAVFGDELPVEDATLIEDKGGDSTPPDIAEAAAAAGFSETKAARVVDIYRRFKSGEASNAIAEDLGIARGQVSAYLKDAERLTGETLRPRAKRDGKAGFADLIERTRVTRRIGKYAASIWGWHNLRHNFVTVALNSGVPPHKVAAITGHSSVAMTLAYADMRTKTGKRSTAKALPEKPSTDAFIASLSASERKDLARKLLGL